jgi:hypothetical protein
VTTANTTERVLFAELKTRIEYQRLLPAMQVYVAELLQDGEATGSYDFLRAAAIAYPGCALKPHSLAVRSSQLQSHPLVARALALAFGTEDDRVLLSTLKGALRKSIQKDIAERGSLSDATVEALKVWERRSGKKLGKTNAK